MRGHGYEPDPMWNPLIGDRREAGYGGDVKNLAHENAPAVVAGQIGLILVITLGLAFVVNLVLFAFNIG